jgi:hypothetical protein
MSTRDNPCDMRHKRKPGPCLDVKIDKNLHNRSKVLSNYCFKSLLFDISAGICTKYHDQKALPNPTTIFDLLQGAYQHNGIVLCIHS